MRSFSAQREGKLEFLISHGISTPAESVHELYIALIINNGT